MLDYEFESDPKTYSSHEIAHTIHLLRTIVLSLMSGHLWMDTHCLEHGNNSMTGPGRLINIISLLFMAALLSFAVYAQDSDDFVLQLTIEGSIGPATDDYLARALNLATLQQAELVVIRMDTPGGLDTSMRNIIKSITNSAVPIASYVAPSGSRAASAGTYILYASHIAAMAPGTNLGAATPVQIGGLSPTDIKDQQQQQDKEQNNDIGEDKQPKPDGKITKDFTKLKAVNDAAAYIRGLAQLRGRNQEWAEKAVREAASLPASEALKLNVIDIIADDIPDLLAKIDGREVQLKSRKRKLETTGLPIRELNPDWRSRFLSVITNPNIAYILLLIGIYGLIFEFSNPGIIVPGTVGAIALLLALYAFQLLPVNYAGMGLLALGLALMVGEAFQPSFGILGIGGIVAFVFGSVILIDTDAPGFGIDISVIATFALTSVLVFIFVIGMAIKARHRPVVSGMEELLGCEATVIDDFEHQGRVSIHSEIWNAFSNQPLRKDQLVKVTSIKGLTLEVEAFDFSKQEQE